MRTKIIGLETGDASELYLLNTGGSIVSGGRYGAYCLRQASTANYQYFMFGGINVSRLRMRFAYKHATNSTGSTQTHVFDSVSPDNATYNFSLEFSISSADVTTLSVRDHSGSIVFSSVLSGGADTWRNVAVDATKDTNAADGAIQVWVDGVSVGSSTTADLGTVNFGTLRVAPQTNAIPTSDWDDLEIDDSVVPGIGGVIARQPKTGGTPTYDDWTKSSGSDAGALWDNTPFDTTDKLTSYTADAAQTAQIASFSSTQTGHGSGTIQSYDTINGIKEAFVAKTAATTAAGITQVGNILATSSLNGVDVTLTFSTAPQTGDVVYVWGGHTSTRATPIGPSTSGYNVVDSVQTQSTNTFGVWRKVMGNTPDTNVVCQGTGNTADSTGYGCIVLRQVNTSTPEDATIVWANGSSTNPNPGSITPATTGATVIICAGSVNNDSAWTSPANYGATVASGSNDTNPYSIGGAVRTSGLTGGTPEDPASWTGVVTGVWIAATIAIRPATQAGSVAYLRDKWPTDGTVDTQVALTTSDAYYETTVFLAGTSGDRTQLLEANSAEIGVKHGNNSLLQTVEDVWLMASYTPGVAPAKKASFVITNPSVMRAATW